MVLAREQRRGTDASGGSGVRETARGCTTQNGGVYQRNAETLTNYYLLTKDTQDVQSTRCVQSVLSVKPVATRVIAKILAQPRPSAPHPIPPPTAAA